MVQLILTIKPYFKFKVIFNEFHNLATLTKEDFENTISKPHATVNINELHSIISNLREEAADLKKKENINLNSCKKGKERNYRKS